MTKTNIFHWLLVGTIVGSILVGLLAFPKTVHEQSQPIIQQSESPITTTTEDRLDKYLSRLADFECPNCRPRFKRLDSNHRFSYGCLQFQLRTWLEKYKAYISRAEDDASIVEKIYSCELQKRVARAMFEENEVKASYHWYTSIYVKGLGLPSDQ